jgi:hypothetical protein
LEYEELGFFDVHRNQAGQPTHWIALVYKVRVDPNEVVNGEPHKFDDERWFRLNSLPLPLHSQFTAVLEKFKEKLT